MVGRFDFIKDLNDSCQKIWRLKVRIIRLWRVPNFKDRSKEPTLEMVFMDEQCGRIQCFISSDYVQSFEEHLSEGKVYMISNVSIASNSIKYKATTHEFRLFFKKETQVKLTEDPRIPLNGFKFVKNSVIAKEENEDSHLVDVIGLLTAKANPKPYTSGAKNDKYIVIQLDDLESEEKLKCTLWEGFAKQLTTYMDENPGSEYIVILQFGKMKNYMGSMEVSNTNYTSRFFINADLPEVRDFKLKLAKIDSPNRTQVTQIISDPVYSIEEDFLTQNVYKTICDLRESQEKSTFVTIGTINDIESKGNWWYKGCKRCFQGLKRQSRSFHCRKCNSYPTTFIPRYSIHLRVVDETGSASFILYDREASKFLNKSANDLRAEYVSRGGDKNKYPEEINEFKDKRFLFKVSVRVEDLNSFQPCVITILKLCSDEAIVSSFIEKYNIHDLSFVPENSDFMTNTTEGSEINKPSLSESCESTTPSKPVPETGRIAKLSDAPPTDFNVSSTEISKLVKEDMKNSTKGSEINKDSLSQSSETPHSKNMSEVPWTATAFVASPSDFALPSTKMRKVIKQKKD